MRSRIKLAAWLIAGHFLCLESFAGIAFGLNSMDSHCKPGACFCARMTPGHHHKTISHQSSGSCPLARAGLARDSGPCGAHRSAESPPPTLKITPPLPPFDVTPGQLEATFRGGRRDETWKGYGDVELPPPR